MFENVTSRYDMSDATIEIIIMLFVAFLLGLLLGYLLSRGCCKDNVDVANDADTNGSLGLASMDGDASTTSIPGGPKPTMLLSAPDGEADDLKRISGVGPVLETVLNDTGIFHYRQIAELTSENITWLDDSLAFPGRIKRENWVGQARALMDGVETEFADRYDKGETTSST